MPPESIEHFEKMSARQLADHRLALHLAFDAARRDSARDMEEKTRKLLLCAQVASFKPFGDELTRLPEYASERPSVAFKGINRALGELFTRGLLINVATFDEDESMKRTIEGIFLRNDWSGVGEGHMREALLTAYATLIRAQGELVKKYVEKSDVAREIMTSIERLEYSHFGTIADATNELFFAWRNELKKGESTNEIRNRLGMRDELAVVRKEGEGYREVKWHEAFEDQTKCLAKLYKNLAAALSEMIDVPSELEEVHQKKIAYYTAVAHAWETSDENDWRVADTLLPQQVMGQRQAVHIHTIEKGYGADHFQRVPEASMGYPDDNFAHVDEMGQKSKAIVGKNLASFVETHGLSHEIVERALPLLASSAFSARYVMGAGRNIGSLFTAKI